MSASVLSYKVGICRGQREGAVRTVDLEIEDPDLPQIKHVVIDFFTRPSERVGFLNREAGTLALAMPATDFDPMYELLRAEETLYFNVIVEPGDDVVVWASLSTSEDSLRSPHRRGL